MIRRLIQRLRRRYTVHQFRNGQWWPCYRLTLTARGAHRTAAILAPRDPYRVVRVYRRYP